MWLGLSIRLDSRQFSTLGHWLVGDIHTVTSVEYTGLSVCRSKNSKSSYRGAIRPMIDTLHWKGIIGFSSIPLFL